MNCPRCDAQMTACRFEDAGSTTSRESFPGWQCLLCGQVIDPGPGIIADRNSHQGRVLYPARPRCSTVLAESSGSQEPKEASDSSLFNVWKRWIANPLRWVERALSRQARPSPH